MRKRQIDQLLMGAPEPVVWAILALPRSLPAGWKRIDQTHNGAAFRGPSLLVRVRGIEVGDQRWWHMMVLSEFEGQYPSAVQLLKVAQVFCPAGKQVVHAIRAGDVQHLWARLDASALPGPEHWADFVAERSIAATWEGSAGGQWEE